MDDDGGSAFPRHERHEWWIRCDSCRRVLGQQLTHGDVFWHVPNVLAHGGPDRLHSTVCPDCRHFKHYEIGLHLKKRRKSATPIPVTVVPASTEVTKLAS